VDEILVDDLIASPVQSWAQLLSRAEILRCLSRKPSISIAEADETARQLNISRRRVFSLLRAYRNRVAGALASGPRTGQHDHIDEVKENIIAQALVRAGPAARYRDVWQHVVEISHTLGRTPPSQTSVKTRFGRCPAKVDLAKRLNADCDFIVDMCELEIWFQGRGGRRDDDPEPAHLLAVIEVSTGTLIHHRLFAGSPEPSEIAASITTFLRDQPATLMPRRLGLIPLLGSDFPISFAEAKGWTVVPASSVRKLAQGSALKAIFGTRMGRIPIRTGRKVVRRAVQQSRVPMEIASEVVRRLATMRSVQ